MVSPLEPVALGLLRELTGDPRSVFRPHQLETIERLVEQRQKVFLVQRTGWGKSAVYFVATKMFRDRGLGPTLLVSPLLALMRNQIEAARRMGVRALTINSSNQNEWDEVKQQIRSDEADLLLISPERLANQDFQDSVLPALGRRSGLLVIDETHCISDWGHDFRPDYRRVVRVLDLLPTNVPVLCCTATANDRVVDDVVAQLGDDLEVVRGELGREGLGLHVLDMPSKARRLAWLSETISELEGTGIVYCLTIRDTLLVSEWLVSQRVNAAAYSGATANNEREKIEQELLANDLKVVVATSALGMGFDKPDLSFVIHFQAPSSPIAYYQQVGRAGRSLNSSLGVLLCGTEDRDIQDYFIDSAFPPVELAEGVVNYLEDANGWCGIGDLESRFNQGRKALIGLIKKLTVEGAVEASGMKWRRTLNEWEYDHDRASSVTALRREEQEQMGEYTVTTGCRMAFLRQLLNDPDVSDCGCCDRCTGRTLERDLDRELLAEASDHVRSGIIPIEPRKQWPSRSPIPKDYRLQPGRALSRWGDGGWGDVVRTGKQVESNFDEALVQASVELITNRWRPDPLPEWVTYVPSIRHPNLVAEFSARLAESLGLFHVEAIVKTTETDPQKSMENSAHQYTNVKGAFEVDGPLPKGPVLLVDDVVDSRWTLTVIGTLLLHAYSGPVYPFALASAAVS